MSPAPSSDLSVAAINRKRQSGAAASPAGNAAWMAPGGPVEPAVGAEETAKPKGFQLPFDPLRLVDVLLRRWWLPFIAGCLFAVALAAAGFKRFETRHVASLQLMKQAPPTNLRASESGDPFKPREISIPTLISMMRSSAVLERVAAQVQPSMDAEDIRSGLTISPERNTDIIFVSLNSPQSAEAAVKVLNLYADEVLRLTRQMQQQDASEMNRFLLAQLKAADDELLKANEALLAYAKDANLLDADKQMDAYLGELGNFNLKYESTRLDSETLELKIKALESELAKVSNSGGRVQTVRDEIAQLLTRYTEEHPAVIEARERLAVAEKEAGEQTAKTDGPPAGGGAIAESLYLQLVELRPQREVFAEQLSKLLEVKSGIEKKLEQLPRKALEYATIKGRQQALITTRGLLASRQREAALYENNSLGYYRLLAPARPQDAVIEKPTKKIVMFAAAGFVGGLAVVGFMLIVLELMNQKVRTPSDLRRATGLSITGVVPGMPGPDDAARAAWAFRTWTRLAPSLAVAPGGAVVAGFLGEGAGDLPSRLARLLATAAQERGSKVVLLTPGEATADAPYDFASAVAQPAEILTRLHQADQPPLVALSMPEGSARTPLQRQKLRQALTAWGQVPDVVVLVALPPAEKPETLLLAEILPRVLWVASGEVHTVPALKDTVQIYRDAGCELAGSFMEDPAKLRPEFLQKAFAA